MERSDGGATEGVALEVDLKGVPKETGSHAVGSQMAVWKSASE